MAITADGYVDSWIRLANSGKKSQFPWEKELAKAIDKAFKLKYPYKPKKQIHLSTMRLR